MHINVALSHMRVGLSVHINLQTELHFSSRSFGKIWGKWDSLGSLLQVRQNQLRKVTISLFVSAG